MAIAMRAIAANIAALHVTGLTICDLDKIPETVDGRGPVLYPEPAGFVTELRIERDAFGTGTGGKKSVYYTLTYTFAYCRVGEGRGLFDKYPAMVDLAADILDVLVNADASIAGAVLMNVQTITEFGPVVDPSGNLCHGCKFLLDIQEFIN